MLSQQSPHEGNLLVLDKRATLWIGVFSVEQKNGQASRARARGRMHDTYILKGYRYRHESYFRSMQLAAAAE